MKANLLSAVSQAVARRVYGPFRETGGTPGDRAAFRLDTAARAYLWNRHVRRISAKAALDLAAPAALRPFSARPPQWYGGRGGAGARFMQGGDVLRWIEDARAAGLRFIGWSDELPGGPDHTGWYCDEEGYSKLRGGVWQLPGKGKAARLFYSYAEFEGNRETNPGSAALCVSDMISAPMAGEFGNLDESDACRDCARWADSLAENAAEVRREYEAAYQAGRQAAELDAAALAAHAEALELVASMRAERTAARLAGRTVTGTICAALGDRLSGLLETISAKRAKRDSAWAETGTADESAWRAGFCDEAADGFRRAVRLGYAKATDWAGPAEANPCNEGVAA